MNREPEGVERESPQDWQVLRSTRQTWGNRRSVSLDVAVVGVHCIRGCQNSSVNVELLRNHDRSQILKKMSPLWMSGQDRRMEHIGVTHNNLSILSNGSRGGWRIPIIYPEPRPVIQALR